MNIPKLISSTNIKIITKITITTLLYYLDNVARPLVSRAEPPGNVDESKVCDDRSTVLKENVLCLQILPTIILLEILFLAQDLHAS